MRLGLIVTVVLTALVVAVAATGTVATVIGNQEALKAKGAGKTKCDAAVGPSQPGEPDKGAADSGNLDPEQQETVKTIISIGKQRNLSPRAWQVAIQAGMTESGLRNLTHGDRDSLGIFQMRPSMGWGSVAQVTDPPYQVNKFFDVLTAVPGWEDRRPGDSAQAVERSGFPDRYHKWEPMAVDLVEHMGEVTNAAGCGEGMGAALPPSEAAAAAIQFALKEQGKPYVWGGTGPDVYDCSGLTLRAFEAAGITIPRVASDQYKAGAMLPVRDAQPGDLVFWSYDISNPVAIHHVAIYLGDNKIVEAQQDGVPVHIRPLKWEEAELVPQAVRPGT